jgi:hypothetical protein
LYSGNRKADSGSRRIPKFEQTVELEQLLAATRPDTDENFNHDARISLAMRPINTHLTFVYVCFTDLPLRTALTRYQFCLFLFATFDFVSRQDLQRFSRVKKSSYVAYTCSKSVAG